MSRAVIVVLSCLAFLSFAGVVLIELAGGPWSEPRSVPAREPPTSLPKSTTTAMTIRIEAAAP